jgi:hypothetical protein
VLDHGSSVLDAGQLGLAADHQIRRRQLLSNWALVDVLFCDPVGSAVNIRVGRPPPARDDRRRSLSLPLDTR